MLKHDRRSHYRCRLTECMDALGSLWGEKMCFSPPPPFNLTGGSHLAAYGEIGRIEGYRCMPIKEMNWATVTTWTSTQYMKYPADYFQLMVLCTIVERSYINTVCVVPQPLLPSLHWSMQFVWFLAARYPFISSHPPPTLLLQQQPLFLIQVHLIPWWLHHFITAWSRKLMDLLGGYVRARLEMHLEAKIEWVWGRTWRPYSL